MRAIAAARRARGCGRERRADDNGAGRLGFHAHSLSPRTCVCVCACVRVRGPDFVLCAALYGYSKWIPYWGSPRVPFAYGAGHREFSYAPYRVHAQGAIARRHCALTFVRAATYDANELNTNACRAGYSKIMTDAGCEAAAASLGFSYYGNSTYPSYPSGCFFEPTGARLNLDPVGAAASWLWPLCQISGAPLKPPRRPPTVPPWGIP